MSGGTHSVRTTPDMLSALCKTYGDLLRRQRTAESAFASWGKATRRVNEFAWLGGAFDVEPLLLGSQSLVFAPGHALFETIHKMYGTARLNPYERELLYGFPYVIGRLANRTIRGPLLTAAVEVVAVGARIEVRLADDVIRFNSLPFRSDYDTGAHDQALVRVLEATPALPLTSQSLKEFVDVVKRELPSLQIEAALDGNLALPPSEPRSGNSLRLIDQAALFIAPKVNYFLRSDLEEIAESLDEYGALGALVSGGGDQPQVDLSDEQIDSARLVFPFPSNRAQRKVALLVDDATTNVIRVEGPPGTGKSLTIANLACHLAASGRKVLITSQKDKALEVVDDELRQLNLSELPMTLLRHERDSKGELIARLEQVSKQRSSAEVSAEYEALSASYDDASYAQLLDTEAFASAVLCEDEVEKTDRAHQAASSLRRLSASWRKSSALRHARRRAPDTSDVVADRVTKRRHELARLAFTVLGVGLERSVSVATRGDHQARKELLVALRRDQRSYRNFSLFDRLKQDPERAEKLLRMLPVWIMSPDDAARLFPCRPGLFDVVIVDEASQVDLPSIAPLAYRAAKLVIFGDTKQMQSQRFAFMSRQIATEAWERFGMKEHDPDELLHPVGQSLLGLAGVRAEEEVLLDEHFRSLPPIIEFSNHRWYGDQLRVMTDVRNKKFGRPDQPAMELHHVTDGSVTPDTQENEAEARALVQHLAEIVGRPEYVGATIGVICLFVDQVGLVQELVTDTIDEKDIDEHKIVVVNPDGFQGDERDVILYSLSFDNGAMPREALSARQSDLAHIQGMLNVAFTRAKDELHVFHSAPIETFTMASGKGVIADWLTHCAAVQARGVARSRQGRIDSEFEAEVAEALRAQDVAVTHQYPACGFEIDLFCERDGRTVAVECDGELYHLDEHGQLKLEDIERQRILESARYRVVRIPYRKWRKDRNAEVLRVLEALRPDESDNDVLDGETVLAAELTPIAVPVVAPTAAKSSSRLSREQAAIVEALRSGLRREEEVLRFCRDRLGHGRLGPRIKQGLLAAVGQLNRQGLVVVEDGEFFLTPMGRSTDIRVSMSAVRTNNSRSRRPSRRRY